MLSKEARSELGILKHGDSDSARLGKVVAELNDTVEQLEVRIRVAYRTFAPEERLRIESIEKRIQALEKAATTNAVGSEHGD